MGNEFENREQRRKMKKSRAKSGKAKATRATAVMMAALMATSGMSLPTGIFAYGAENNKLLAFAGAEGGGRYATGGRGYDVYVVTNLEDYGRNDKPVEGSLRYGIEEAAKNNGGTMIVFMAIIKVETIIRLAEKHGFYYKTTGIWHKTNPMPRNMNLHFVNSTEAWIYFTYKTRTGTFNNSGALIHDFIETSVTPNGERRYGKHPTQKPESLIQHFVEILSNENEWVLDPFMGSGTTGVVAKRTGRNFIGVELNKDYFEIAKSRIEGKQNETNSN